MTRPLVFFCCLLQALLGAAAEKSRIRVFVLAGQSNMVGLGLPQESPPDWGIPLATVRIKAGGDPRKGWGALDPTYGADGRHFGPELGFGQQVARRQPGELIALVKFAVGGKSLCVDYRPPSSGGTMGPLYRQLVDHTKTALTELAATYEVNLAGMCWMQGESDAVDSTCAPAYATNLANFIRDVRHDLGAPALPFVIGMIDVQPTWTHSAVVRQAQVDAGRTLSRVAVFDTRGLPTDGVHYTSPGLIRLGQEFASHAAAFLPSGAEVKPSESPAGKHAALSQRPAAARPNILFVMTDQQSAAMMSCTGNPWVRTPHLDALARQGIRFDRAYAANPVCVPSRFSLLTGRMPSAIGMEDNHHQKNAVPHELLASSLGHLFRRAGYDTVYTGKKHLTGRDGENGYENPAAYGFAQHLAPEDVSGRQASVNAARRFLRERGARERPFLLFVSLINPHDICYLPLNDQAAALGETPRYQDPTANRLIETLLARPAGMSRAEFIAQHCPPLPDNFEIPAGELPSFTRVKADNYIGWSRRNYTTEDWRRYRYLYARLTEVVDTEIGAVLEALRESGLERDTLVVFTSDHGEQDASHRTGLKGYLYEESARIPLILKWPGPIPAGRVDQQHLVSNGLDLLPTLCDYAGIPAPPGLPGRSLRPLAEGAPSATWRDTLVVENNGARLLLFDGTWKYLVDARQPGEPLHEMLIHLASDPGEMMNLAGDPRHAGKLATGRRRLRDWYAANIESLGGDYP